MSSGIISLWDKLPEWLQKNLEAAQRSGRLDWAEELTHALSLTNGDQDKAVTLLSWSHCVG